MSHCDEKAVGLDLGSTAAKSVFFSNGQIQKTKTVPSHRYKDLLHEISHGTKVFSTGYFRKSIEFEESCTEITAAKYGAQFLVEIDSPLEILIDIGGQDTKVIDLRGQGFLLNDKCSAGTGAFLQFIAQYLGLSVNELGILHQKARGQGAQINSTCSVFALSEVISHLVDDTPNENLVAGIHHAFARKIAHMVPKNAKYVGLLGWPALNPGVVDSLASSLGLRIGKNLLVIEPPQFVNAIGAVLFGLRDSLKNRKLKH